MHRRVGKLIGTLRQGSMIHEAPLGLKAKGVIYIAVHPDEPPLLITPWGITPLVMIPEPEPVRQTAPSHSIAANRTPIQA